jgi:hypothetical protein
VQEVRVEVRRQLVLLPDQHLLQERGISGRHRECGALT